MALKNDVLAEQHHPDANILIVDDTPANLEILHALLIDKGYSVRVASSGKQAVASAQASPPDLILLDIMMPEMDGYQVCTHLKAHDSTRNIPVIFLSVLESSFDKVQAFSVGAVDYITKPFEPKEALARVKTHLALQTARRQLEEQNSQLTRLNNELTQEIAERVQLEAELEKHRDHLEELVAERTAKLQQEIIEREQAEEQLRKLSRAVEQSSGTVLITDLQGNIEYVNAKFTQVTGYTPEEVAGKNPRLLQSGKHSAEFYQQLWDTITAGLEWHGEFYNRKKNGDFYWELVSISPIRNSNGDITHFVNVGEDITERKQTEQALQDSLRETTVYAEELAEEVAKRKQVQLEREHLLKLERRQRLHAEALRRTATALSSTLNYEKVLDLILEQIDLIVVHDTANIMLVEGETAHILRTHRYRQGKIQTDTGPTVFDIAKFPPLQTLYTTGQPLIISDAAAAKVWELTPNTEWIKSYIGVPIQVRRQVIGFMNVNSAKPEFFNETHAERLQSLAYQAGTAIENARLFKSMSDQKEQLRALTNRLTEVEEAERRQLARELHDQVGQNLTALSLNLKIVQNQIEAYKNKPTDDISDQLINRLADSLDLVEETTVRSRNVMDNLRPPALEEYGLLAALKWYVSGFQSRTNVEVTINGAEPEPRLPAAIETVFFRITQEALTNVARHAQATYVEITLDSLDDSVRLIIADDGVGFDAGDPNQASKDGRQHWGLLNMIERAYAVGGQCRVDSGSGKGTRVTVEVKK